MKKKQVFLSGILALLMLAIFRMMSFAAEVVFVQGSVQTMSPQDSGWRKVETGMQLATGDVVRTARNSLVDIALDTDKRNTIRVEQKTQVVLNSAAPGIIDRLDLSKGRVYANLEDIKSGMSFEINTPSAIAGVRGSSLSVYVEKDTDEVMAIKDTVFLKTFDEDNQQIAELMLPEGFKTLIERFSEPGAFSQITERDFRRSDRIFDRVFEHSEGRENREEPGQEPQDDLPGEQEIVEELEKISQELQTTEIVAEAKEFVDEQKAMQTLDDLRDTHDSDHDSYYNSYEDYEPPFYQPGNEIEGECEGEEC